MSLVFTYDGSDLGTSRVRLGKISGLIQSAEKGTVSISSVPLDDPSATLAVVGLKSFNINETAATPTRLFSGYTADRAVERADSLITGSDRRWDVSLVDLNAVFGFRIISGSDGNRPEETDVDRLNWLLGSPYLSLLNDNGLIDYSGPVTLDETDYRGQFALDVMNDLAEQSGKNFWAYNDDPSGERSLAYFFMTSATYASTLRLTNVLADVDDTTTFAAGSIELTRDPSQVYSGVYLPYTGGAVYVTRPSTASAFGSRDIAAPSVTVRTSTRATTLANRFLDDSSSEDDRIRCVVKLPAANVNDIAAGHRIQVRFSHLPGYTSYTWTRVMRRTIAQDEEDDTHYNLTLELAIPKLVRFHGTPGTTPVGGSPVAVDPNTQNAIDEGCNCPPYTLDCTWTGLWQWWTGTGDGEFADPTWSIDQTQALMSWNSNNPGGNSTIQFRLLNEAVYNYMRGGPFTMRWEFTASDTPFSHNIQITVAAPDAPPGVSDEIRLFFSNIPGSGTSVICDVMNELFTDSPVFASGPHSAAIHVTPTHCDFYIDDVHIATVYADIDMATLGGSDANPTFNISWQNILEPVNYTGRLVSIIRDDGTLPEWCNGEGSQLGPEAGQEVSEDLGLGTGTRVTWTVSYPYQPASMRVRLDGIDVTKNIDETNPGAGTFTFGIAPKSDERVTVTYQGSGA